MKCWLGFHSFVGVCGYALKPFPGVTLCFHKEACSRCGRTRERLMKPLSNGDAVEFAMNNPELMDLVDEIMEDK